MEPSWADQMLAIGGVAFEGPTDAATAYPELWSSAEAAKKALSRGAGNAGTFAYRSISIRKCPRVQHVTYHRLAGKTQNRKRAAILRSGGEARTAVERLLGRLAHFEIVQENDPVAQPDDQAEVAEAVVQPVGAEAEIAVVNLATEKPNDFPGDHPFRADLNGPLHEDVWPSLPPLEVRLRAISFTPSGKPVLRAHWLAA